MRLKDCRSFGDLLKVSEKKTTESIFNYIDGAADDESTYSRNTKKF